MCEARSLLDEPDSILAQQVRYGLAGLRAALAAALGDHPRDPGAAACQRYLTELDAILDDPVPRAGAITVTAGPPGPGRTAGPVAELLAGPDSPPWLRSLDPGLPPDELWHRCLVAALRLPPAQAQRWRAAVAAALAPDGQAETAAAWRTVPDDVDTVLVPPFLGTAGLRAAVDAAPDPEVVGHLRSDPGQPLLDGIARAATTVLAMAELDADLQFALESVRFRGIGPFDEVTRGAFRRDLLDRLRTLGRARPGSTAAFEALLLVDEALHSVLHLPVAAPGSWWARRQERSRALVFEAQRDHPGVNVQLLARPYRDSKIMTGGNDIRHALDGSGSVLTCLRLFAQIDGRDLPGRVVYAG